MDCFDWSYFTDAERVKKIQNKAIVNESPTDKLIRELKEENTRLLKLVGKTNATDSASIDAQELLAANMREMESLNKSWEDKLRDARQQWESEAVLTRGTTVLQSGPRFENLNEDPQVSIFECFNCSFIVNALW